MNNDAYIQLAKLVLPRDIEAYFEITKVDVDEHQRIMYIHLDEKLSSYLCKSEDYESKGFTEAVSITDFPIRDHKVILKVRRRRWIDLQSGESFIHRISITEEGTRYSKEFAAFLKETYGCVPRELPYT